MENFNTNVTEHPAPLTNSSLNGQVLIVEDNPNDVELLRAVLKSDFQVESAPDGESGFEQALQLHPDCIISDIMMPMMSGFTFLKKIRAHNELGSVPLIFLTALDEPSNKVHGYELLADLYLTKPVDTDEIKAAVNSLVRMHKNRTSSSLKTLIETAPEPGITYDDQQFLTNPQQAVQENISNMNLSVDNLAQFIYVSKRQLERRLRSLQNISPSKYVRQVRLDYARQLAESGTVSNISEMATRVGFKDPKHFAKLYHSFYGVRPQFNS